MEKKEVSLMLDLLFNEFDIEPVPITIKNVKKTYGGVAIQIGLKVISTLKKLEDIILHEFAHTLDYRLTPNGVRIRGGKRSYHDEVFMDRLREVVIAWYGDESKYQWSGEYKTIQKIYKERIWHTTIK